MRTVCMYAYNWLLAATIDRRAQEIIYKLCAEPFVKPWCFFPPAIPGCYPTPNTMDHKAAKTLARKKRRNIS